jgi:hypothetical protein
VTLLLALCCLLQFQHAAGHALDQSNLFLNFESARVHGRLELAIGDINTALNLALPTDDSVSAADIEPYLGQIRNYVNERVKLSLAGRSGQLPFTDTGLIHLSFATFLQLNFSYDALEEEVQEIDIEYALLFDREPDHRGMLVIENNWKSGTFGNEANVSLVFEPGRERQTLDLSDSSTLRGFLAMVRLGSHHIWIGIDHILFLLALLLPAVVQRRDDNRWEPVANFRTAIINVIKVVTVFTVAHTITLSLAALNTVALSSRLVESIIALSIAIAALNIVVPIFRDRIWLVVFAFGLFHGFGFASVLGEIGIPSSYLVHSLLGFNVGVELGQVAIVIGVFPVLYLAGRSMFYSRFVLPAMTAGLIAVSLYWFTERAFLVDLPAGEIINNILALAG